MLTPEEIASRREAFRVNWAGSIPFNVLIGLTVEKWDEEGCACRVPFNEQFSGHKNLIHGGVLAALIDTTACGSIMSGENFEGGTRLSTVSMTVNYLSNAPGEDLYCEAVCVRRGKNMKFAEAKVYGATSRKLIASGVVTANLSGARTPRDGEVPIV